MYAKRYNVEIYVLQNQKNALATSQEEAYARIVLQFMHIFKTAPKIVVKNGPPLTHLSGAAHGNTTL